MENCRTKEQPPPVIEKSADDTANGSNFYPEELTLQEANDMADLQTILQELRDFRRENGNVLRDIKGEMNATNKRVDEAENRISGAGEQVQVMEEALLEVLKLQERLEARFTDQEARSRRDNIRVHGIVEGAEEHYGSGCLCGESATSKAR